jgi:hypothetical protein
MLARTTTRELLAAEAATQGPPAVLTPTQRKLVERVAYAIPRIGARVPWRSDCLVQALAAQRWLEGNGIATTLTIGVRNDGAFAAHAWLEVGGEIVTGGTISEFTALLSSKDDAGDQRRTETALARNQR